MNSARQALENVERVSDRGLVVELWCGCGHDLDWYRTSTGNARCRVESCCGATTETLRGRTVRPQLVMATKPRGRGDYTKGCVTNWLNSCGRWVRRWTWSESFCKGLQRTYDQIGSSKNKTAQLGCSGDHAGERDDLGWLDITIRRSTAVEMVRAAASVLGYAAGEGERGNMK